MQFYSVLDNTQEAVGQQTWEVLDDPTARGCVIPLWLEGEQFPGFRIGPAPRDPQALANKVFATWTSWGYKVDRSRVADAIELQGRNSLGELVIFRVSGKGMTLQGESECRPA